MSKDILSKREIYKLNRLKAEREHHLNKKYDIPTVSIYNEKDINKVGSKDMTYLEFKDEVRKVIFETRNNEKIEMDRIRFINSVIDKFLDGRDNYRSYLKWLLNECAITTVTNGFIYDIVVQFGKLLMNMITNGIERRSDRFKEECLNLQEKLEIQGDEIWL